MASVIATNTDSNFITPLNEQCFINGLVIRLLLSPLSPSIFALPCESVWAVIGCVDSALRNMSKHACRNFPPTLLIWKNHPQDQRFVWCAELYRCLWFKEVLASPKTSQNKICSFLKRDNNVCTVCLDRAMTLACPIIEYVEGYFRCTRLVNSLLSWLLQSSCCGSGLDWRRRCPSVLQRFPSASIQTVWLWLSGILDSVSKVKPLKTMTDPSPSFSASVSILTLVPQIDLFFMWAWQQQGALV